MSDKLRVTMPIETRFSAGEIVDPTKLDGFSVQTRRAASILEYVIGDAWNSGGDSFFQAIGLTDAALMIPNIARYLGIISLTNPRIPNVSGITQYTHVPLAEDGDKFELFLSLPPTADTTFTLTGSGAPSSQPKSSITEVVANGDWYVNRTTGYCFFTNSVQADWTITYTPTVASEMGDDATFNVMPDPNTNTSYAFRGCKIAYANNVDNSEGYIIFLPPRGPLSDSRRADRAPQSEYDVSNNTNNMSVDPDNTPVKMWQDFDDSGTPVDATVGDYAESYRYVMPKIITDNWSAGSALPMGFIYLWDHSQTGTFIEGISFAAENGEAPRKYVIIASGAALDTWVSAYMASAYAACGGTDALTQRDDHSPTFYPPNGLRVVTVGNSLSAGFSKMAKTLLDHDHGSANSHPGKPVSHAHLIKSFAGQYEGIGYLPSTLENDWHPQYLHRAGYCDRDLYANAMMGDLLLSGTDSAQNYLNITSDSRRIRFGNAGGPQLYRRQGSGNIDLIGAGYGILRNAYYFSIEMGSNGTATIANNYGGLILKPAAATINYGDSANQDGITWVAGAGLFNVIGGNIITTLLYSGGFPSLQIGSGQKLTDAADGSLAIESPSSTAGEKRDGELTVNRIHGGTNYHTGSSVVYGEAGGGYGPPRTYVIPFSDFTVIDTDSIYDEDPKPDGLMNSNTSNYSTVSYDYVSDYGKKAVALYLISGIGTSVEAFGWIKLPFLKYGLVGAYADVKLFDTFDVDQMHVAFGKQRQSQIADGPTTELFSNTDVYTQRSPWQSLGNWNPRVQLFSLAYPPPNAPLMEIDNSDLETYPLGGPSYLPFIRFHVFPSTGREFAIGNVVIIYRIKEW